MSVKSRLAVLAVLVTALAFGPAAVVDAVELGPPASKPPANASHSKKAGKKKRG